MFMWYIRSNVATTMLLQHNSPTATQMLSLSLSFFLSQMCKMSARSLSQMINMRELTIITDPQLSTIKVAQLERIHFHNQATPRERKGPTLSSSSSSEREGEETLSRSNTAGSSMRRRGWSQGMSLTQLILVNALSRALRQHISPIITDCLHAYLVI